MPTRVDVRRTVRDLMGDVDLALLLVQIDEANRVRAWLGKPPVTLDEIVTATKEKLRRVTAERRR